MHTHDSTSRGTVDPAEIAKFERMAADWWNPDGMFRPLHAFNPTRLAAIRDIAAAHFARGTRSVRPFAGLSVLDIGCGGGLLCEPMTRLGAAVTGIDPLPTNVEVARLHAAKSGLAIDYRAVTAEALAAEGARFDLVLALEVVEHVADVPAFIAACANLMKPGGLLLVATINRTPKAFTLAIVAAEYVLRWLPRGTHDYDKLVTPAELEAALHAAGLAATERAGFTYSPLSGRWTRGNDLDVNYMLAAGRVEGR